MASDGGKAFAVVLGLVGLGALIYFMTKNNDRPAPMIAPQVSGCQSPERPIMSLNKCLLNTLPRRFKSPRFFTKTRNVSHLSAILPGIFQSLLFIER